MKNQGLSILIAVFVLFTACKQPETTPQSKAEQIADSLVQSMLAEQIIPGLVVAVSKNGQMVWSKGYGYADLEQQVAADPFISRFRIASISKPFAGAVAARLYERGELDVDASIYTYLPEFPRKKYDFSTRQLAGHVAGIRHYRGNEFLDNRRYETVYEGLHYILDDTLLFEPGTRYNYSTYGWNLLSAVLEKAGNKDFLTLLQEEVLMPLGLEKTHAEWNDLLIPYRGRFYQVQNDQIKNAPYVDNSVKWAGGGLLSTADDLVRFGEAFLEAGYLKQATIDEWVTSLSLPDGTQTGYGFGFRSGTHKDSLQWFGHSGGAVGGSSLLVIYPKQKVVVSIIANRDGVRFGEIPFELGAVFMEKN
jgi:CubicO group peptidase (beta-lactamase class C family)